MGFVIRCGIGNVPRPCLTAFVLSLNGSAITLSRELWERGVRDAKTLRKVIEAMETGSGGRVAEDFITYHRGDANVPDRAKGRQVYHEVAKFPSAQQCRALRPDVIAKIFREDLYHRANALSGPRESFPAKPSCSTPKTEARSLPDIFPSLAVAC